jgi:hypothetical protein
MNEEQLKIELSKIGTLGQCREYANGEYGISLSNIVESQETLDEFDEIIRIYVLPFYPIVNAVIMSSETIKAIYKNNN